MATKNGYNTCEEQIAMVTHEGRMLIELASSAKSLMVRIDGSTDETEKQEAQEKLRDIVEQIQMIVCSPSESPSESEDIRPFILEYIQNNGMCTTKEIRRHLEEIGKSSNPICVVSELSQLVKSGNISKEHGIYTMPAVLV